MAIEIVDFPIQNCHIQGLCNKLPEGILYSVSAIDDILWQLLFLEKKMRCKNMKFWRCPVSPKFSDKARLTDIYIYIPNGDLPIYNGDLH